MISVAPGARAILSSMSKLWLSVVGLSLAGWWSAAASGPDDTARLAEMMRHTRGSMWLAASEFRDLQAAYLSWIDTRVKAGATAGRMSAELKAAGLLPTWSDDLSEMDRSHAGYVEPIRKRRVEDAPDVFVLEAAIYKGGGCSVDVTALVYERAKLKRLAAINAAGDDSYAYYLSGIDAAGRDNEGQRLIASGWVISNCTSTWNGKRIRIDRGGGDVLVPRTVGRKGHKAVQTRALSSGHHAACAASTAAVSAAVCGAAAAAPIVRRIWTAAISGCSRIGISSRV